MSGRVVDPQVVKGGSRPKMDSELGVAASAVPSVAMPQPVTELSELLAGDATLCIRRSVKACRAEVLHSGEASAARPILAAIPCDDDPQFGPELARVVEVWPSLPRNAQRAVLAVIDAVLQPG
jgi:hypothetical protein